MTARTASSLVLAALLGLAGASALAANAPVHAAPAGPAPAPTATPQVDPDSGALVETAPASKDKDAKIEHLVTEDSQVRIEETRVRGNATKIVVHSKITGDSYEIKPRDPHLDPEHDKAAGMRTFTFGF
jgi:hypothetical protein